MADSDMIENHKVDQDKPALTSADKKAIDGIAKQAKPELKEVGGPKGLEPTRYGDWESKGRCYDF